MSASPSFSPNGKPVAPPPVPPKPIKLQTNLTGSDSRRGSEPIYDSPMSADGKQLPSYNETIAVAPRRSSASAPSTPAEAKNKRPWLNRIVLAGEVVLSSLESTAHELINTGTAAASSAAG